MHVVNVTETDTESESPREAPLPVFAYKKKKKALHCSAVKAEVSGQYINAGSRTQAGSTVLLLTDKVLSGPSPIRDQGTVVPQSVIVITAAADKPMCTPPHIGSH